MTSARRFKVEHLEQRCLLTTNLSIFDGDLIIDDAGPQGNDNLTLSVFGPDLIVEDPGNTLVTGIAGSTGSGTNLVTIPLSSFSDRLFINTLDGDDTVTFDPTFDLGFGPVLEVDGGVGFDQVAWNSFAPPSGLDFTAESIQLNDGLIDTGSGPQVYNGNVTLANPTTILAGDVIFNGSVNGAFGVTLNIDSKGGTVIFGGGVGTNDLDVIGANTITVNQGLSVFGNILLNAEDGVFLTNPTFLNSSFNYTVEADGDGDGDGTYLQQGDFSLFGGDVTIIAADVDLQGSIGSTGTLTIAPSTVNSTISLGTDTGSFALDDAELFRLGDGFSSIRILGDVVQTSSEDFEGNELPSGFELAGTNASFVNGAVVFDGNGEGERTYLRTLDADFFSTDFIAEVTVDVADRLAFFGMGAGQGAGLFNEPGDPTINLRLHDSTLVGGRVDISDNGPDGALTFGFPGTGTHRLRLIWDALAQTAQFEIDVDFNELEPFEADLTSAVIDGSDNGFNVGNARLFFGGSDNNAFDDFEVTRFGEVPINLESATFRDPLEIIGGSFHDGPGLDISAPSVTLVGAITPGQSPGILQIDNLTLGAGSVLQLEIGGPTPGEAIGTHDQILSTSLDLEPGVTLDVITFDAYTPLEGDVFTLVSRATGTGLFEGIPEGFVFVDFLGSGLDFALTYEGGASGSDIVLSVVEEPPPPPPPPPIPLPGPTTTTGPDPAIAIAADRPGVPTSEPNQEQSIRAVATQSTQQRQSSNTESEQVQETISGTNGEEQTEESEESSNSRKSAGESSDDSGETQEETQSLTLSQNSRSSLNVPYAPPPYRPSNVDQNQTASLDLDAAFSRLGKRGRSERPMDQLLYGLAKVEELETVELEEETKETQPWTFPTVSPLPAPPTDTKLMNELMGAMIVLMLVGIRGMRS